MGSGGAPGGGAGAGGGGQDAGPSDCIGRQSTITAGQDCVCPDDCASAETCADEISTGAPGGMCLRACFENDPCPGELLCVSLTPGDPNTATCLLPCDTTGECPAGDICKTLEAGGPLVCAPLCQSDADCPGVGACDRYSGFCAESTAHPEGGEIGAACERDADCKSAFCIPPSNLFPEGLCTAFCSLSLQGCPEGSACTANWSPVGDEGLCFSRCTGEETCRTGFVCGAYPGFPDDRVCAPAS